MNRAGATLFGLMFYASTSIADDSESKHPPMVDPVMFGAGVATTVVAGVAVSVGAGTFIVGNALANLCFGFSSSCHGDTTVRDIGTVLLVSGGLLGLLVGVPMMITGGAHRTVSVSLSPIVSPQSGGLNLSVQF